MPDIQQHLDVDRIARSTLSDALKRFNTQPLFHVLERLKQQLPPLGHADANLEQLTAKRVAIDGSYFKMAGDIAWALRQTNANGKVLSRVHPVNRQQVRLLTDLLDVEAWIIAYLYRCRWIIELFFRWLKVTAAMEHLVSHSANGITVQFYVAAIAVMMMHIQTGLPVSKYALVGLSFVARGQATLAQVMPGILRLEREKMLAKQRLARKKAAAQQARALPSEKTLALLPG